MNRDRDEPPKPPEPPRSAETPKPPEPSETQEPPEAQEPPEKPRGRRGGTTTLSVDGRLIRKTFVLDMEVAERLRDEAHHSRVPQAEIVRRALRERYGLVH